MRHQFLSKDLFPIEYSSAVNENDPCRTFVPIEQVADPSALWSFEDIEIIKKINQQDVTPTEKKEVKLFITELNGCIHINTEDSAIHLDESGDLDFFELRAEDFATDNEEDVKEELIFVSDDTDYERSNREKIKGKVISYYMKRREHKSNVTDHKNRSKKFVQKKQRSRRITIAGIKMNGFIINQSEEINIFDFITE